MNRTELNVAILEHRGLWWTPESEAALEQRVGSQGLAAIRAMYDLAADEVLWRREPGSKAYDLAQRRLEGEYPFVTPDAIRRLANMAAYTWK